MWVVAISSQVVSGVCFFPEKPVLDLVVWAQVQCKIQKVNRFSDLLVSKPDSEWLRYVQLCMYVLHCMPYSVHSVNMLLTLHEL